MVGCVVFCTGGVWSDMDGKATETVMNNQSEKNGRKMGMEMETLVVWMGCMIQRREISVQV